MSDSTDAGQTAQIETPPASMSPSPLTPNETASYHMLRAGAVWFESAGHWSSFRGPKASDALNGLITNDVSTLRPGEGLHAAALTPKGKLLTDLLVIRLDDESFLMTVLRSAADAWMSMARRYVNPRLAKITDESDQFATWMLYGSDARSAVARLGGASSTAEDLGDVMVTALAGWPVWHHGPWNLGPVSVRLIRAPLMGELPGFIVTAKASDADLVRSRLQASTLNCGTRAVWDVARVEGGRPAWGSDMDESTLPQEANLDTLGAISFTKGCYTGQETVARIHFRGHVNRNLRGLLGSAPMPQGASVLDASGKTVGDVRSTVISPRLGPIAMAMLRREVANDATVFVQAEAGAISARATTLPFPEGD